MKVFGILGLIYYLSCYKCSMKMKRISRKDLNKEGNVVEITNYYSHYGMQNILGSSTVDSTKKKDTKQLEEKTKSSQSKSTEDYINELKKLAPSVEFRVGNTFSSEKSGKTLTINPKLLEEMQNNPEKEKEMKELIHGVESAVNMLDNVTKASGWTVVFKHCYIDENGKFCSIAYLRNDFMLNMSDKLREERRKNSEKFMEKSKEKSAKKKEELQEELEENRTEKADKKTDKAEKFISEKITASKDGMIYLYDTDIKAIMEAIQGDTTDKTKPDNQNLGANLDLQA